MATEMKRTMLTLLPEWEEELLKLKKMGIGQLIKTYLDENGIKYSFVANELKIAINIFSVMLNGKRKITAEEFINICSTLKVDANYFAEKFKQAN